MPLYISARIVGARIVAGSIYYDNGRVRLAHQSGPKRAVRDYISFCVNAVDFDHYRGNGTLRRDMATPAAMPKTRVDHHFLTTMVDRNFIDTHRLIETTNDGSIVTHISRGSPVPWDRLTADSQMKMLRLAALVDNGDPAEISMALADDILCDVSLV